MKNSANKKLMPLPKLLEKTQKVFNAFVRKRDKEYGCISCGAEVQHAGHYHSQGHYSALRFNLRNTNGQCIRCNMHLSGNLIKYRQGLVNKIGEQNVLALEDEANTNRFKKWSRDELENIINEFK